jgi:hypothetical protein
MISLLVSLIVILLVFGVVWYIIGLLPLPDPFGLVVRVVFALVLLLVLLNFLVPLTGAHSYYFRY